MTERHKLGARVRVLLYTSQGLGPYDGPAGMVTGVWADGALIEYDVTTDDGDELLLCSDELEECK